MSRPRIEIGIEAETRAKVMYAEGKTLSEILAALLESGVVLQRKTLERRLKAAVDPKDRAQAKRRLGRKNRGRCEACREVKPLVIDHCHRTGLVRGLLCNNNVALGFLKDSSQKIRGLLKYARKAVDNAA